MIPRPRVIVAALAALLAIAGLVSLGNWQVHRLAWKRALIARVEARVHASPVAPPGPREWPEVDAARADYRRLRVTGTYLPVRPALVQASTVRGPGWWVLAPLRTDAGFVLLVNRGFVPRRAVPPPPAGPVAITGLLRTGEPGGGFLRANDPAADRWYSRDVAAIAKARRWGVVAPYFVDADAAPRAARGDAAGEPVGGLTVIAFPNNHLVYALTWYGLAVMVAAAFLLFLRQRDRPAVARRGAGGGR